MSNRPSKRTIANALKQTFIYITKRHPILSSVFFFFPLCHVFAGTYADVFVTAVAVGVFDQAFNYAFIIIPRGASALMIALVWGSSSCFERVRSFDTKEKRRVSAVTPASSV